MIAEALAVLGKNNIIVTNILANMTKFYQPLDLTVSGYARRFIAKSYYPMAFKPNQQTASCCCHIGRD